MLKKILSVGLILCGLFAGTSQAISLQSNSADKAAKGLYAAWLKNSRTQAGKFAAKPVVSELFKNKGKGANWQFQECEKKKTAWNCSFYYEGGGAFMNVVKKGGAFQVTKISYIAD